MAAYVATCFLLFDYLTITVIIILILLNIIATVFTIKMLVYRNKIPDYALTSTCHRKRVLFKIFLPIAFSAIILLVTLILLDIIKFDEHTWQYIFLFVVIILDVTFKLIADIAFNKALDKGEKVI